MATKHVEDEFDVVVRGGSGRAAQFLGVIQKMCQEEGLDVNLQPAKRSFRDSTVVLRGPLKVGRGNQLEMEVFADPQGTGLHVGWQATRATAGGSVLGNVGLLGEINAMRTRNAGKAGAVRAQSGILQAFNNMVFLPVVQQLTVAIQAERGPSQNGFLGA